MPDSVTHEGEVGQNPYESRICVGSEVFIINKQ